jgi:hypothetical protein
LFPKELDNRVIKEYLQVFFVGLGAENITHCLKKICFPERILLHSIVILLIVVDQAEKHLAVFFKQFFADAKASNK